VSKNPGIMSPMRNIDVIGFAACAGLTLLGFLGIIQPISRMRGEVATLRTQLAIAERDTEAVGESRTRLSGQLTRVKIELDASPVHLKSVDQLNRRLAHLVDLAAESHVLLDETRAGDTKHGDRYETVPIAVSGSGTYPDCAVFLHRIHEELPDIEVLGFDLSGNPGSPRPNTQFQFELAWYAAGATANAAGREQR
jgi:hypothetical protein